MVEFRGTSSEKIYLRALRVHAGSLRLLGISFLVVGLLTIPLFGLSAYVIAAAGIVALLLPRFLAWRLFRTSKLLRSPISGHVDEEGFVAESENGRSNIAWEKFHRAALAKDVIVLYLSAQQLHTLPREFFTSDAAFAEAQEIVRRHVDTKRRPPWIVALVLWLVIIVCVWAFLQFSSTT